MQAILDRWRALILFVIMAIWPLLWIGGRGTSVEERNDHIGKNGARLGNIECGEYRIHDELPELLASPEQFRVDGADLVEHAAQSASGCD
jgi:hypothetical protein